MKTLIVLGILFILASVGVATDLGVSATWMSTTGIIFILSGLSISKKAKVLTYSAAVLMVLLFIGGLVGGMWYAHPLGGILSFAVGGWTIYHLIKSGHFVKK